MKLLLDAMFAPVIAEQLRQRGHDAEAATARSDLEKLRDPELFAAAQAEQRALVTNNVGDFLEQDQVYRERGASHYGLILTSDHRFRRAQGGAVGHLVLALDRFLRTQPTEPRAISLVHWLQ